MTSATLLGHSAVLLEKDGQSLIIDPGLFSDLNSLSRATSILITHGHADHAAVSAIAEAAAEIWAPQDVINQFAEAGVASSRLHAVAPGDAFTASGFDVSVHGGQHAEIYPGLPPAANNAYLVDDCLLHPGDSLTPASNPAAITTLLLPVAAPWLKLADAIDYARTYSNATVFPIHDGILSEPGKQLTDGVLAATLGAAYSRPQAGATLAV